MAEWGHSAPYKAMTESRKASWHCCKPGRGELNMVAPCPPNIELPELVVHRGAITSQIVQLGLASIPAYEGTPFLLIAFDLVHYLACVRALLVGCHIQQQTMSIKPSVRPP